MRVPIVMSDGREGFVFEHGSRRFELPPHQHDDLEVNLVVAGRAACLIGDRRLEIQANDVLWLHPDQVHGLLDPSDDFRMWVAHFQPALLERTCTDEGSQVLLQRGSVDVSARRLPASRVAALVGLFAEIRGIRGIAHHNAGLAYLAMTAWRYFEEAPRLGPGRDVHPAVAKAARLLGEEGESRSIGELARRCGLGESRLRELFRHELGLTLVAYRNRRRIDRYLALIDAQPRPNLTQAALEAGFGSYAQFNRVFKQVMGCRPADYKDAPGLPQDSRRESRPASRRLEADPGDDDHASSRSR